MLESLGITIEQFEKWSLYIGLTALVLFLLFIIFKLGKESKAGKFGFIILFIGLGMGVFGFVIKEVIKNMIEK